MQNFYFSLPANLVVRVTSSGGWRFDDRASLLARAYLPGLKSIEPKSVRADVIIEHIESGKKRLVRRGSRITIYDRWGGGLPLDFFHLLYSAARVHWLKRGLFSVHAACVGADEHTLIVGHTGVGKTSILLRLARDHGQRVFSGNKTIVSFERNRGLTAVAGTRTLTARAADMARHADPAARAVEYGGRVAFLLNEKNYARETAVRVRAIVIARLNDVVEEFEKMDPLGALHTLYPYFLDTVNADTIVCEGKGVFIGTPPTGVQERLATALRRTLAAVPTYSVAGSVSFVASSIAKL